MTYSLSGQLLVASSLVTDPIYAGGVCLVNSRAIQSDLLVIELATAGGVLIQTLAQILRRQPLGSYFDVGIAFVTKLATRNA